MDALHSLLSFSGACWDWLLYVNDTNGWLFIKIHWLLLVRFDMFVRVTTFWLWESVFTTKLYLVHFDTTYTSYVFGIFINKRIKVDALLQGPVLANIWGYTAVRLEWSPFQIVSLDRTLTYESRLFENESNWIEIVWWVYPFWCAARFWWSLMGCVLVLLAMLLGMCEAQVSSFLFN